MIEAAAAIIALLALAISWYYSFRTFRQQQKITIHAVRPVLHVGYGDFENRLIVQLENKGTRVAMIDLIEVYNNQSVEQKHTVYDWLPKQLSAGVDYKYYLSLHNEFPIAVGEKMILIEVTIESDKPDQCIVREDLRNKLSELRLEVDYKDIYGNPMKHLTWNFDYFARKDNVNRQPIAFTPSPTASVSPRTVP